MISDVTNVGLYILLINSLLIEGHPEVTRLDPIVPIKQDDSHLQ